ncbi:hypothetical protein CGRA01v4_14122 [Colletotrichum graminicola]|nr:hypothetical protein CGRA01v4_14122 [Colletotrichum graminicola]
MQPVCVGRPPQSAWHDSTMCFTFCLPEALSALEHGVRLF